MQGDPAATALLALGCYGPIHIGDRERSQRPVPSVEPVQKLRGHTTAAADRRLGQSAFPHPVRKLRNARGERPGRALGDRQPADKVQPVSHRPPEGRDCGGTGRPATPWPRLSPALDGGVQLLAKDALIIPHVQQLNKRQLAARR